MIAYKTPDLDNAAIQDEALAACKKECITQAEYKEIKTLYPTSLYTPNPFIRIGLFLLTAVVVIFTMGLISLVMLDELRSEQGIGIVMLFFGVMCYGALEAFVGSKHHFRSGVDDALAWGAAGLILAGLTMALELEPGGTIFYLLVLILGVYFAIRFLNMLMGLAAFAGLLGMVFFAMMPHLQAFLPFTILLIAAGVYLLARRFSVLKYHAQTLALIEIAALVMFYLAGNYYVVRETSNEMNGGDEEPAAGWLFWLLTVLIPLVYIYGGIRKKDKILLRTGLLLIAAIVFTIRYYHSVMPLEVAMVFGGAAMILIAYALTKYLKTPQHGFTNEEMDEAETLKGLQIAESLIIAQTMKDAPQPTSDQFEFGGGSTRGGGAGGDY